MPSTELVTNADIILWALFELEGSIDFVDVETVYLRAFELAPERLSWRTQTGIPDLKKCAKSLQEAEARKPPLLVKNGAYLRMLTVEGLEWIEKNFDRLAEVLSRSEIVQAPRRRRSSRLVSQALSSDLFKHWEEASIVPVERWTIAQFLNCSLDSDPKVWSRRLEELRSAAHLSGNESLKLFIERIRTDHKELFIHE